MDDFISGLAEIFEVDDGDITPDFDLETHNWDSLAIVSVIALVDSCCGKLLNGRALAQCKTVSDIEALANQAEAA
ncbi:MAG TPA: acyl carrier protein [Caulobacteraceae bacterium]